MITLMLLCLRFSPEFLLSLKLGLLRKTENISLMLMQIDGYVKDGLKLNLNGELKTKITKIINNKVKIHLS